GGRTRLPSTPSASGSRSPAPAWPVAPSLSQGCRAARSLRSDLDDVAVRIGDIGVGNIWRMLTLVHQRSPAGEHECDGLVELASVLHGDAEVLVAALLADPLPLLVGRGHVESEVITTVR